MKQIQADWKRLAPDNLVVSDLAPASPFPPGSPSPPKKSKSPEKKKEKKPKDEPKKTAGAGPAVKKTGDAPVVEKVRSAHWFWSLPGVPEAQAWPLAWSSSACDLADLVSVPVSQQSTLKFLSSLAKDNSKDFMDESRDWYANSKDNFLECLTAIVAGLQEADPTLEGLVPKDALHRIKYVGANSVSNALAPASPGAS